MLGLTNQMLFPLRFARTNNQMLYFAVLLSLANLRKKIKKSGLEATSNNYLLMNLQKKISWIVISLAIKVKQPVFLALLYGEEGTSLRKETRRRLQE